VRYLQGNTPPHGYEMKSIAAIMVQMQNGPNAEEDSDE